MKPLKRIVKPLFYFANGEKIEGANPDLRGNCTGLQGDCSEIPYDKRPCDIKDWVEN